MPKPPQAKAFPPYLASLPPTVRAFTRALRAAALHKESNGDNWRDVINELRPYLPDVWASFSVTERRRFFRHAMAYWDIHRHRLAPSAHYRLSRMRESGQVEVIAGTLLTSESHGISTDVVVRERGSGAETRLSVGSIVNCTGPHYDIATLRVPLVAQLRDEGLLRQDALRIGLDVDEHYQVIGKQGKAVANLFYIGPMLKARYWEAIAVPELRMHSQRLAATLLSAAEKAVAWSQLA